MNAYGGTGETVSTSGREPDAQFVRADQGSTTGTCRCGHVTGEVIKSHPSKSQYISLQDYNRNR